MAFNWNYEKVDQNGSDLMIAGTTYGDVRDAITGEGFVIFSSTEPCPDGSGGNCVVTSGSATKVMLPGRYTMSIRYIQGYITRANASWDEKVPITQRAGGGIRIKSIINYDSNINQENGKPAKVRKFYYTEDEKPGGKSAGKLISTLRYDYRFSITSSAMSCAYRGYYLARMSSSIFPVGFSSKGTVVGYDKVTEIIGENGEGGKNVYYFHNMEDYQDPISYPGSPTYSYPLVGKMAVMATFDSAGTPLRTVDYIYQTKETFNLKGFKLYNEATFKSPTSQGDYYIKYYDCMSSWNVLSSEEERIYSTGNNRIVTIQNNYYDNPSHKEITQQQVLKSDGSTVIKKYKYPGDYTRAGSGSFVSQMKLRNIISPVIEEQTLLKKGSTTKLLSGSFTEYKLFNGTFYKPGLIYKLENSQPLPDTTESDISASNQLGIHPSYQPEVYFDNYNPLGNIVQYHKPHDDNYQTYIWDYKGMLPIADILNAAQNDVAYSSFEANDKGNWNYSGTPQAGTTARTGKMVYNLETGVISVAGVSNNKIHEVTYWSNNGAANVNEVVPKTGNTINGWTYYEHTITAGTTTITVSGTKTIDELRLQPQYSLMTTYTYEPHIGMTSSTDANNYTTYYVYDNFGRLSLVKDDNGNILKKYEYQYANQ